LVKSLPFVPQFAGDAHPIFIDDVVDMMLVLAKHPGAVGEAFNCAPDPSIPWTVYLDALAAIAGNTARVRFPARHLAPLGLAIDWVARFTGAPQDIANTLRFVDTRAVFSMQKAKDRLGWAPRVSLAEGMKATAPWLLQAFGTRETAGVARS
jgi:nucleoside-diphosphate-sugar epimerase